MSERSPLYIETDISIKIVKQAAITDLIALYKSAGWWEPSFDQNHDFLNNIVKDSAIFAGAFYKEKLIGMGRALSDLASDAYIQDVAVLNEFRGQGIGKKLIQLLIEQLKENSVDWIGLIASPGTSQFYKQIGFKEMKNHVPLKYDGK